MTRESEVQQALSGLNEGLGRVRSAIQDLERRLGPVMGPPPPADINKVSREPAPERAFNVAAAIRQAEMVADGAMAQMAAIISRLEV